MPNLLIDLPVASVILVLSLVFLFYMHKMHKRQLKDRQKEINRLASENREYREMFLPIIRESTAKATRETRNIGD